MKLDETMDRAEVRPKVLVIDDDDAGRELTVLMLESRGFSVAEADCGEQAIAAITDARPCVVLLDALMPGIDGFETCRRIRTLAGAEHLPILMLTGLDDDDSVSRAYEVGATDFFVKSEHWTLLAQRIRYLLRASRMRDELASSRAKEAWAQRIARLGYWEWDVVNRSFVGSEECFRLMGRPPVASPQPISTTVCDIVQFFQYLHIDDRVRVEAIVGQTLSDGGAAQFECRLIGIDSPVRAIRLEIEVDHGADGTLSRVYGVIQDITERKRTEDQIQVLANYDSLTGLSNRRHFQEQFAQAIERARPATAPVAMLILDLDRFRQINDTLGYAAGDALLTAVAARLMLAIRERGHKGAGNDLVARLVGDQFAIMLTGLSGIDEAEAVTQRIQTSLAKPIRLADQDCITSACFGIAAYPRDGNDAESVMRCADTAMNAARTRGPGTLQMYKPGLNATSKDRLILELALHKALDRKELIMYYQPQIDTRLGKIIGAEALMRWQHDGRLVPPGDFIAIAEEVGLIVAFGEWAINNVMGQNRTWIDAGYEPLPMAVNIPGSHFERSNFVDLVQEILKRQRITPEYLELEITETTLMRNLTATMPTLDALTSLGIRLSVDDFGTGYSSLSYLRRLPIDTLKIDASFVRELQTGSDNEAIVAAIIAMAKSLNLRVIAEGVETHEQMCILHAYGCHIMQGYYFSKPVPAAEFAQFRREYGDQKPLPKAKQNSSRKTVGLLQSAIGGTH
jgi:diguanylate cyclase (GGDEF)-like protein